MVSHFSALVGLLGVVIGLLVSLVTAIWKARGWVDRLDSTDARLATAIETLTATMKTQHAENQRRLDALERASSQLRRLGR
jgi:hypothetical protein